MRLWWVVLRILRRFNNLSVTLKLEIPNLWNQQVEVSEYHKNKVINSCFQYLQSILLFICNKEEEENIARRTRSKVSLEDTDILDLEANFVPPDFTPDMYDTSCEIDDPDYLRFLTSLVKPAGIVLKLY